MSKQNKENTQSFMNNVTIILISQVLVKVLGMVYRIVITNIDGFGDEGLGFYNVGFQIYTLLLAISSVGIPNAISKMVSERVALDDYKGFIAVLNNRSCNDCGSVLWCGYFCTAYN